MHYIIALTVPLAFILLGALAKKLVRGSGWARGDFFLGVELALAALASSLVFILELSSSEATDAIRDKTLTAGFYTITNFFLLFVVMSLHQDWEKKVQDKTGQSVWLGGVSNVIGAGLLAGFVLLVKGVGQ